jgi:hypothetical protein
MKFARDMNPVRRELMVVMATLHNVALEGMQDGVDECRRQIELLRVQHPDAVEQYFEELQRAEQRRNPEALAAIEAMYSGLKG